MDKKDPGYIAHARYQKLINRMWVFFKEVKASDCAGLAGQGPKTEYTHLHRNIKKKGGKPPADYTAVEMMIDFKLEMGRHNYDDAIPLYYSLKRMLNWE